MPRSTCPYPGQERIPRWPCAGSASVGDSLPLSQQKDSTCSWGLVSCDGSKHVWSGDQARTKTIDLRHDARGRLEECLSGVPRESSWACWFHVVLETRWIPGTAADLGSSISSVSLVDWTGDDEIGHQICLQVGLAGTLVMMMTYLWIVTFSVGCGCGTFEWLLKVILCGCRTFLALFADINLSPVFI